MSTARDASLGHEPTSGYLAHARQHHGSHLDTEQALKEAEGKESMSKTVDETVTPIELRAHDQATRKVNQDRPITGIVEKHWEDKLHREE